MENRLVQDVVGPQVLICRGFRIVAVGSVLAGAALVILASPASAGTGTGGGTGGCTDNGHIVTCGSGISGTTGTASGAGGTGASGSGAATTTSVPTCPNYVPYSSEFPGQDGGPPPAGTAQPGAWYINTCSTGSATGQATGVMWLSTGQVPPAIAPPDPSVAAARAASELALPAPTLMLSPSTTGYVNLAEWLWITPSIWHPFSTTAQACNAGGCVAATAVATPSYVTWDTGDGSVVVCDGPGTPYDPSLPAAGQSTACSHTYATTSAGQPSPNGNPDDAAFPVTATITWIVTWTGPDGSTGTLPSVATRGATSLVVAQIESVNT